MQIDPKIFKAYDIRGDYPQQLNEDVAYKLGQSFAKFSKAKKLIVGRDNRLSSPSLSQALINGIIDQGVNVIDIGLCSTSCFYFSVGESDADGGIMTTASHSPKNINGFKMVSAGNTSLTREQILDIKKIVIEEELASAPDKGEITRKNATDEYVAAIRNSIKEKFKPLKIVLDAGNGTAGLYIEKVFADTGLDIVPIFLESDGNFPNHETNPKLPENRIKLVEKIISEKADLGFMFDGDADRLCVLDRNGNLIDYSLVLALVAEYMVKNSNRKKVVMEVRTSNILRDWVEKSGGEIIISTCWTIPIKLKMKTDPEIVFGGETSGHLIFPILHETDDGIFGALTFLQAISAKGETIDKIVNDFKNQYHVMEEKNFEVENAEKAAEILEKLKVYYSKEGAQILEIDGISVIFPDWWFNLRRSESDPVIRLNMEAGSEKVFNDKKNEVITLIESYK